MSFHHHDVVGAKLARKRMQALRFSNDEIKAVAKLVELHLRFHGYGEGEWTDSAVRRYVRDAGDQLERLHILTRVGLHDPQRAQGRPAAPRLRGARVADRRAGRGRRSWTRCVPTSTAPRSWRSSASAPGPVVGEAYRFLLERRIDEGPLGEERATPSCWPGGPRATMAR